jgi:phosphohistidine phosphatase
MVVMTDDPARLLVLVRHAKAESGEEGSDHDRRLTGRGRSAATEAGRWLAGVVPAPDAVWCSSAVRAVQTWEAMAPSLQAPEPSVDRELYLAGAREVVERLAAAEPASATVVVGHNPTVEQVLATLTGELRGMRPGAVAVVDLSGGRLVMFWEPSR